MPINDERPRRPSFGSEQSKHNTGWSWARPNIHGRSSDSPVELDWSPPLSHLGVEDLPDLDDLEYPCIALRDDADHWNDLDQAFDPEFTGVVSLDVEKRPEASTSAADVLAPEEMRLETEKWSARSSPTHIIHKSKDSVFSFSQPASLIDHLYVKRLF